MGKIEVSCTNIAALLFVWRKLLVGVKFMSEKVIRIMWKQCSMMIYDDHRFEAKFNIIKAVHFIFVECTLLFDFQINLFLFFFQIRISCWRRWRSRHHSHSRHHSYWQINCGIGTSFQRVRNSKIFKWVYFNLTSSQCITNSFNISG